MDNNEIPQQPVVQPAQTAKLAPTPEEKTTFSLEYVQELRAENAKYRTSAKESAKTAEQARANAEKVKTEADERMAQTVSAADQRIIRAELKAEAIKAGMVDLDGLKLADLSAVKLDENGEVVGAGELMATLKEAKPYLFTQAAATTTTPKETPTKKEPAPFNAKTATEDEIKARARELGLTIKTH